MSNEIYNFSFHCYSQLRYELDVWAEKVAVGFITKSKLFWRARLLFLLTHQHFAWYDTVTAASRKILPLWYMTPSSSTPIYTASRSSIP